MSLKHCIDPDTHFLLKNRCVYLSAEGCEVSVLSWIQLRDEMKGKVKCSGAIFEFFVHFQEQFKRSGAAVLLPHLHLGR